MKNKTSIIRPILASVIFFSVQGFVYSEDPATAKVGVQAETKASSSAKDKVKEKIKKKAAKKKKVKVKRQSAVKVKEKKVKPKRSVRRSLQSWLKKMKKRVSRSYSKRNQLVSVAAVRGNKKPDSPPLYWKGKKSDAALELSELQEFDLAIEKALSGDKVVAIEKLEAFTAKYPKSPLLDDANHTLAMLKTPEEPQK